MLEGFQNASRVPELRRRLLFTFGMLAVCRVGVAIPTPGIDSAALRLFFEDAANNFFGLVNLFSGGALAQLWRSMTAGLTSRPALARILRQTHLSGKEKKAVARLVRRELVIAGRINRLQTMQQLFKYWHVAHLPFALVMLIIMVIHVAITLAFGYRWIF